MLRRLKTIFWSVIGIWRIGRFTENRIRSFNQLIKKERQASCGLSLRERLWAIRRGFYSSRLVMYGLTTSNFHNFVPDLLHEKLHPVNGRFSALIDGKFPIRFTLKDFPDYLPDMYYLTRDGLVFGLSDDLPGCQRYEPGLLLDLLERKRKFFAKPESGGGGHGVYVFEKRSGEFFVNGQSMPESAVRKTLNNLDDHLISECVEQHAYARNLFAGSANTIRLISIRDEDTLLPVFISAFHRVGTKKSQPADNLDSGGLFGKIDLATGELGKFAFHPKGRQMAWHTHHPETGVSLEGVIVPQWKQITESVLEISRKLPFLALMGYDVVLTDKGIKILEINSLPTVLFQAWEPAMLNKNAAAFFTKRIPQLKRASH